MEKETYRISVRELVEFVYRSGDLDNRRATAADQNAMLEGARIHRLLQNKEGPEYRAEVPLAITLPFARYDLSIDGRADGILETEEGVTIDEIKGMYQDVTALTEPIYVHLAQAMCYAYLYAEQEDLAAAGVRMTYCNLETEELQRFFYSYTRQELSAWFLHTIGLFLRWTDFYFAEKDLRTASIKPLVFPYAYRPGQKELAADVYRTIHRGKLLFLQAPTGVGKTMATVFPALKAMGEGEAERLFYLTAKTVTARAAEDAFSLLREQSLHAKQIRLTAKEKICPMEEMDCNPESCPYAKGHMDRVNDAVFELLTSRDVFDREVLLEQAKKHKVCPFEMGLDVSSWCALIICDVNYAFDPRAKLKRFFAAGAEGENILLADEAHNLVDRARSMFSAELAKEAFLEAKKYMKKVSASIARSLDRCNRRFLELKRETPELAVIEDATPLMTPVQALIGKIERFLPKNITFPERKEFLEFYFSLRDFAAAYERSDEHYLTLAGPVGDRFMVRFLCVDPSRDLQECLDRVKSAVFFSATLLPVNYYKKLLCTEEEVYAVYARSVFQKEQRCLLAGREVTTKYTRRGPEEYQKIAAYIRSAIAARTGNYMVFFPSYKMLRDVYEACVETGGLPAEVLLQESDMTESDREEFLKRFEEERAGSLAAFCVLGGIFGEGIDLPEERLIGVVVVGTGLPQVSKEREILKDYFDERYGSGFDFAYRYPGMNKVLQAAGRVIRTVRDKGIILLLDERFLQAENRKILPREWEDLKPVTREETEEALRRFWG